MENLTIIIPVGKFTTDEQVDLCYKAIKSAKDNKIIVVGPQKELDKLNKDCSVPFTKVANKGRNTSYSANVNLAVKDIDTDYFSVLEFDDIYSDIWFKNAAEYIKNDTDNVMAFLPLTEVVDYNTQDVIGYSNEAVWAASFSDELGYFSLDSLMDYLGFNMSGAIIRKDDYVSLGGLKESMKLVNWYEFLLRVLYKEKKIFVVPKVGYYHFVNRPESITTEYQNNMTEKEADWWIELAKKEYFFPQDRKKTYSEDE